MIRIQEDQIACYIYNYKLIIAVSNTTYAIDIHKISYRYHCNLNISIEYPKDVEIKLKLRKIGFSMMIAIPSQVVEDLQLKAGDQMLLDVKDSNIIIRKKPLDTRKR